MASMNNVTDMQHYCTAYSTCWATYWTSFEGAYLSCHPEIAEKHWVHIDMIVRNAIMTALVDDSNVIREIAVEITKVTMYKNEVDKLKAALAEIAVNKATMSDVEAIRKDFAMLNIVE